MKFTGFMNGCGGKILIVILCIILGVILTLGGIAGAGYYALTKKGMLKKTEEYAVSKGYDVDFDDTIAEGTVLDWGKQVSAVLKDMQNNTVGKIESLIGMPILSNTLNQILGIDPKVFKDATISKLGETISDNMTMILTRDKFGITFPDMPIFSDEEFLAKPIGEAFGNFDEYKLGDVIKITETAHAALKVLSDTAIKDIGTSEATKQINGLSLCELMTIDEKSSATLKAMQYNTIDSTYIYDEANEIKLDENGRKMYATKTLTIKGDIDKEITVEMQGISDKMKELTVAETISITAESNAVLRKMRIATTAEMAGLNAEQVESYIKAYIAEIYQDTDTYPSAFDAVIISDYEGVDQDTVNAMPLSQKEGYLYDFLSKNKTNKTYSKSYNQLMSEAAGFGSENLLIEDLGGSKFQTLIDNTTMGEFITIREDSEPMLKALKDTKIKGLNARIKTLQLDEIFAADSLESGALALIEPSTTLSEIPDAMSDAIKDSTIAVLKGRGVIAEDKFANIGNAKSTQQSYIYNSSVGGFLGGVIDFIADPIANYHSIEFNTIDMTGTTAFTSLTNFVNGYAQYESIELDAGNVVVIVDTDENGDDYKNFYNAEQDCYLIPVFSLETETAIFFTDGSNDVGVKLAVYNYDGDGNASLSKHQYAFFYTPETYGLPHIDTIYYGVKK